MRVMSPVTVINDVPNKRPNVSSCQQLNSVNKLRLGQYYLVLKDI